MNKKKYETQNIKVFSKTPARIYNQVTIALKTVCVLYAHVFWHLKGYLTWTYLYSSFGWIDKWSLVCIFGVVPSDIMEFVSMIAIVIAILAVLFSIWTFSKVDDSNLQISTVLQSMRNAENEVKNVSVNMWQIIKNLKYINLQLLKYIVHYL